MKKRLTLIISAPVLLSALLVAMMLYLFEVQSETGRIKKEAIETSNTMLTHLQNVLNSQLVSGTRESARLSLSVSAMHSDVRTLLLSDERDRIMLANRYIWEGEPASIVREFDPAMASKVRARGVPEVFFSSQSDMLRGYYPVTIRIVGNELGRKELGVLFFEYDIKAKLAHAREDAAMYSMLFGGLLMLSAILVSLLLRRLVSLRIEKLVHVTQRFAQGELGVRANMQGGDEIAFLANSFDAMAAQREKVEHDLASDIAERKKTEARLLVSEERLNQAQHIAHVGSWELDLVAGKLSWSDEIFNLFEIDKEKFGATYEAFLHGIHPDDRERVNLAYSNSLVTRQPYEVMHRLLMGDGRIKWVEERCSSEFDAEGKPLRSVGTVQDITALHTAQLALEEVNNALEERVAQRTQDLVLAKDAAEAANRSKSLFLTSMSHELRTPLNAILGYAQLMEITPDLPEDVLANAHEIKQAGDLLLALMNDILDLARIETGKVEMQIENVSLVDALAECSSQNSHAAEMRGIKLVHEHSCEQFHVRADKRRLVQVLNNLVSNAIKYNRAGGSVNVTCTAGKNGLIRIAVTDTGMGIPAENQALLFQSFSRLGAEMSNIEGTGIGLVITRRLVEGMAGNIGVESTVGKGSTFWIELPPGLAPALSSAVDSIARIAMAGSHKKPRILVAEDYVPNQNILRLQLQNIGCEVEVVSNGAEALDKWRSNQPDLILTDLNMPEMDGIELAQAVRTEERSRGGHIPIVAITAAAVRTEVGRCREAGMDDVLTKPISLEGLRSILTRWLGRVSTVPAPVATDAATARSDAVLDFNHIYRILGQVDQGQARSLVSTFIQTASTELENLAFGTHDSLLIAREMHKQKSSARTAGALHYARLAEALEQRINAGDSSNLAPSLAALRSALSAVKVALSQSAREVEGVVVDASAPQLLVKCESVLIVDDDIVVLQQMSSMLTTLGVEEVLTAGNGLEAIKVLAARGSEVEVLVCDLDMPEMDGVELIRKFAQTGFSGGLILMSGADEKVLNTVGRLAGLQGLRVLGQLHKPVTPAQISGLLTLALQAPTQKHKVHATPEITAAAIRDAMTNNEFTVWMQPKVDSASLVPVGLEALARWRRPNGQFVSPDVFITVAEQTDLIQELSKLLVVTALTEGAKVFDAGYPLKVAINLSGRWLNDLNLPDYIDAQTKAAGLKADNVMLEVTETGVMEDLTTALDVLTRLRLKGFGLSIDDFGIGYSSFEQLVRIPFTEMKLDRSFVSKGVQDDAARAILESSMDMARKLELSTVAEGVETEADLELVRTLGCDRVQGYLIAKPMPLADLLVWLKGKSNKA